MVKGDAGAMVYYEEGHPDYEQTTAEVWFESAAHAEAAGFRRSPADPPLTAPASAGRSLAAAALPAGAPGTVPGLVSVGCTGSGNDAPDRQHDGYRRSPRLAAGTAGTGSGRRPAAAPTVQKRLDLQLDIPWAAVFLPNGTAIISERESALLKAVKDGRATTIGQVPGVAPRGEGGLLGLALSPEFAADSYLYLYFTSPGQPHRPGQADRRQPDGSLTLGDPEVVFTGIPKASTHNGGRIRFGPDGFLYVGTGDSQRRDQPQDPNALGGKILRLTADGGPAPGNPFGNAVYSLGHRNVQGLAWDSEAGCGPANSART